MSTFHRLLLVFLASSTVTAASCAVSPPRVAGPPGMHPVWEVHMAAGLDASDLGDLEAASGHYRRAVRVARNEKLPNEELAFSIYRLGESIRVQPGLSQDETALALLQEAQQHFARAYGPGHPVLMPVWVRIAAIQAESGDDQAADASRARADAIAVRFFPERHFLRERYGAARPAAILHPLEVLRLLGEPEAEDGPERVVQGPN